MSLVSVDSIMKGQSQLPRKEVYARMRDQNVYHHDAKLLTYQIATGIFVVLAGIFATTLLVGDVPLSFMGFYVYAPFMGITLTATYAASIIAVVYFVNGLIHLREKLTPAQVEDLLVKIKEQYPPEVYPQSVGTRITVPIEMKVINKNLHEEDLQT